METEDSQLHVVVGLGATGLACIRYLIAKGRKVFAMDTRAEPPGLSELQTQFPHVPYAVGGLKQELLLQARCVIVSPGLSIQTPEFAACIARGIPVVGDIELFAEEVDAPMIGITGTNGKSTVTTLVGEMARLAGKQVAVGGNLGTPALDLVTQAKEPAELYVLELSSFQLETTDSLLPRAGCILNITPDHLDRYANFAAYVAAKQRIYKNCGIAVWNRQDANTQPKATIETITFGNDAPGAGMFGLRERNGNIYLAFGNEDLLNVNDLPIQGQHNWLNALAALALGHAIELPMEAMLVTLRQFKGLKHRCVLVRELNGVCWYNDSKATNVGASCAAIEGLSRQLPGQLILIAGGLGKGSDFSDLALVAKGRVRYALVLGKEAPALANVLGSVTEVQCVPSLEKAVEVAQSVAQPGDGVLLAPACASFDMFRDFNHRGDVFAEAVARLA